MGAVRIFDVQVSSCSRRAATIRHVLSVAHTKQPVTLDPNRKRSRAQSKCKVLPLPSIKTQRRGGAAADESEVGTDMESAFEGYEYEEEDDAEAAGGGSVREGIFHWAPPLHTDADGQASADVNSRSRSRSRSTPVRLLYYAVDAPGPIGTAHADARSEFAPGTSGGGAAILGRGNGHENSEFGSDPDASSEDERFGGIVFDYDEDSSAPSAPSSAQGTKGIVHSRTDPR